VTTAATTSGALDFRLLGPLEVTRAGSPLVLGGTRQRALLALLLLRPNETVSVDMLAEELWGVSPPTNPGHAIQVFVSRLRKQLGAGVIRTRAPGYSAAIARETVDLHRFADAVERSRRALDSGDARAGLVFADEALGLWRGQPLADFAYESFALPHGSRLDELRLLALEQRAEARIALEPHPDVVAELDELRSAHPLRERLTELLMLALYRSGRQVEALDVYRAAHERFVEELGLEPGPSLAALNRAILNHDPALDRPRGVPPESRIPIPPTPIVGREEELELLGRLLAETDVRVVTLTGPGGTGKTRLALETARSAPERFADGAFFVSLADVLDDRTALSRVAQALGVTEESDAGDAVARFLATRAVLLVLDNTEQIPDAGPALAKLAASAASSAMLVTSRVRLRIAAERVFDVRPLALPGRDGATSESVAQSPAGALFLARAQAVLPGFAPTDEDAATLAAVCHRLDGLPLALELAAARVAVLSIDELLARLEDRLSILTRGALDGDRRQQTLRGTVEWSYDLLSETERLLFARLAVFADGWTLGAAEAVCGLDALPVLDLLTSLVEESLVARRAGTDGGTRFFMLETIREYALERLDASGESDRVRESHLRWFAALVDEAGGHLLGPYQDAWCLRLDDDRANIRSALDRAVGADPETAIPMAVTLKDYWELRGLLREARESIDRALAALSVPTHSVVDALAAAAWLAFCEGAYDAAQELADDASRHAAALNYPRGAALADAHRAWIAYYRDDYESAVRLGQASLSTFRELREPQQAAEALALLGNVAAARGAYADARRLLAESADISREHGNRSALAYRLADIGFVDRLEGQLAAAAAHFEESLALATRLGQKSGRSYALLNLAAIASEERSCTARGLAQEALELARETGERAGIAQALTALADAAVVDGDAARAEELLRDALGRYVELEDKLASIAVLEKLAVLTFDDGRIDTAAALAATARRVRGELGYERSTSEKERIDRFVAAAPDASWAQVFEDAWARGASLDVAEAYTGLTASPIRA
jgi:predicted ATPase/DNA-binding SARP family transcriptional activator